MHDSEISISPRFTRAKLSTSNIEDKIDVFEDQMQGWIFDHADTLANDKSPRSQHAGFAILMLVTAYFEQLEALSSGVPSNGRSQEFFKSGFCRVFNPIRTNPSYVAAEPVVKEWLKDLYLELRNGLYHELATRSRVFLSENGVPIEVYVTRSGVLFGIDARAFAAGVHEHFVETVRRLRDPDEADLRANFEAFFSNRSPEIEMTTFPPSARSNF